MDKIVMMKVKDIVPYENNPRINQETVKKLVKLIPKVGFDVPLLVDKKNVIIKGHARYLAAKELGMEEIPCIVSENDDNLNNFDRIADNKVHEFTTWNKEELLHEVDMIDTDFDVSELGIKTLDGDSFEAFDGGFSFDDFDTESTDGPSNDEERRQKFLEYLKQKEQEEALKVNVEITTQHDLDVAEEKHQNIPKEGAELVEVVCSKCGCVYYIKKGQYCEL